MKMDLILVILVVITVKSLVFSQVIKPKYQSNPISAQNLLSQPFQNFCTFIHKFLFLQPSFHFLHLVLVFFPALFSVSLFCCCNIYDEHFGKPTSQMF